MARVEIAAQGWGVLLDPRGPVRKNLSFTLTTLAGSAVTRYTTATGAVVEAAATTNASGEIPGFIEEGIYTLTAGSVSKRVEARGGLREFNVLAYGAKGDGSTDDTTAIQAAITAAAAVGGGRVIFPVGVYIISSSLNLGSGVHLEGAGASFKDATKGSVIRTSAAGTLAGVPMINVNDTKFAAVRRLALAPAGSDPTTNTTLGVSDFTDSTKQATFLTVEDCTFRYFGGTVIGLYGDVNYIFRNRADDSNSHFIHLKSSGTGPGFGSDNFVGFNESGAGWGNGSAPGANGDALRLEDAVNNSVCFNHLYNFAYGIHLVGASTYNRIEGNRCEKHDIEGITLEGTGFGNTILGNHVFNIGYVSGKHGIVLKGTVARNQVVGNYVFNEALYPGGTNMDVGIQLSGSTTRNMIEGNFVYHANTIGIELNGATYNSIRGNDIGTCGNEGIYLQNGANENAVTNNYVYKCGQTTDNTYDGIIVTNNADNNSIVGNTVRHGGATNKTRYGINVAASTCDNTTVLSNDCLGAGSSAAFNNAGTGTVARFIRGYVSENAGTATVASGSTSVTVTHGLGFTPTVRSITVVPTNNLGSAAKFWIANAGASTFEIHTDVDPGATTATFAWSGRQAL